MNFLEIWVPRKSLIPYKFLKLRTSNNIKIGSLANTLKWRKPNIYGAIGLCSRVQGFLRDSEGLQGTLPMDNVCLSCYSVGNGKECGWSLIWLCGSATYFWSTISKTATFRSSVVTLVSWKFHFPEAHMSSILWSTKSASYLLIIHQLIVESSLEIL